MTNGWDTSAEAWLSAMADGGDWARTAVLDPIMIERARQSAPAQALDVGCGEGRFRRMLNVGNLSLATAEMTRVLAPGGALLVANLASHNTAGHWLKDGAGQPLGYLIDHYLEERPLRQQWDRIDILNWHRPLSRYMHEFLSCGLRLAFFNEPRPATSDDPTGRKFERAPWFVVMEWRKDERPVPT
ncbi:MAG TPA: class I SAM-dependent methyltransferase [Allosphingosinicella sp.]|nr:class I SAM-dependent methyltransferase [Allosphingosinicella sp.]